MKYSLSDFIEGRCAKDEYYSQFNPITLELGKVYKQHVGSWNENHWKVIFQDDKISLCIKVYSKISKDCIGEYDLFYTKTGFRHNDNRIDEYRLKRGE
jgi:hypothetical protein